MDKPFIPSAVGSQADVSAGVNIEQVFGGYFGSQTNAEAFCKIGISPIEHNLPPDALYADFGGGQGMLAQSVRAYLEEKGHRTQTTVVDGNQGYLESAHQRGLQTLLCNLETFALGLQDLITMRAVLHYNKPQEQTTILRNIYNTLHTGGYFVHQVSSGSEENSRLRSSIVNLSSLGRAGHGDYHWTSVDETIALHRKAGFSETALGGYAPPCSWSPEEQWERFNGKSFTEAILGDDGVALEALRLRKTRYLSEARKVIEKYLREFGSEKTGIEKKTDGTFTLHYQYPIITSRK